MGSFLTKLFVDLETLPDDGYGFVQLIFLGGCYACVLMMGSNMIKDGSELLLLIPSLAGIVGSIVLPVLGAVPDGAIVIFSGLGPIDKVKEQINIGVGALAGSTIMLLTIPWCLSILAGRVNMDEQGNAQYVRPKGAKKSDWSKLDPPNRILGSGVNCGSAIRYNSRIMLLTAISFLIIQIPAFAKDCTTKSEVENQECHSPRIAALIGGIIAILLFVFYLWDQARLANQDPVKEDKIDELRKKAVHNHLVSIRGLFPQQLMDSQGLITISAENKRFQAFLRPFFRTFDVDNSGSIDHHEFGLLLKSLGEKPTKEHLQEIMDVVDTDKSGTICFDEFAAAMVKILNQEPLITMDSSPPREGSYGSVQSRTVREADPNDDEETDDEESDEEEEPEVPEDLAHLSPEDQQKKILKRAFYLMGVGVLMVLVFSDPMVDVLTELGSRTHIKPFYVAFVLAPLASNASELIAAYSYALKKTEKTVTISFSSLIGAACMNNSFCLALFLILVYARDLLWVFSAETLSILIIELIMFGFGQLRVHKTYYAFIVLALFPLAIVLVAGLEAAGLD